MKTTESTIASYMFNYEKDQWLLIYGLSLKFDIGIGPD